MLERRTRVAGGCVLNIQDGFPPPCSWEHMTTGGRMAAQALTMSDALKTRAGRRAIAGRMTRQDALGALGAFVEGLALRFGTSLNSAGGFISAASGSPRLIFSRR